MQSKSVMDALIQNTSQLFVTFQDQDILYPWSYAAQAAASPAGPPPIITISYVAFILLLLAYRLSLLYPLISREFFPAFVIVSIGTFHSLARISMVFGEQKPA